MKYFFLFLTLLSLCSCSSDPLKEQMVPGRIADTKWFFPNGDSLLWVYSLYSTEHTQYSSSSVDRTSTYSHENSIFTVFRLKNNTLQFVRQTEASCINHEQCGTRYTDKIVAYSSSLLAFKCECEGKLIIMDLVTGKDWSDLKGLETRFKECSAGISKYSSISARPDVLELEITDGRIVYLSLEDKALMKWDRSFDGISEVNKGSRYGEGSEKNIYFAPNDGDHRSFLVVRSLKSGTSQDYKHRTGDGYWLNPILLNTINSSKAYIQDDQFYTLHSKTWNDYGDRDLLSKLNTKGETLYTIELKPLGNISSVVPTNRFIYMTNAVGLHVYDAVTGKKVNTVSYEQIKPINQKAL